MSDINHLIEHHQRILLTGPEVAEVWQHCEKALKHFHKPYAFYQEGLLSGDASAPIVFIFSETPDTSYSPHIALIHHVTVPEMTTYEQLIRGLPKAGTLVYYDGNPDIQALAKIEVSDVQKETFSQPDPKSAAKAILKRLGINAERYTTIS